MAYRRRASLALAAAAAAGLAGLAACGTSAAPDAASDPAAAHSNHGDHQGSGDHQEGGDHAQHGASPDQQHHHGDGGVQLWATQTASLGIVALDGAGRVLYRSDTDGNNPPVSRCTGECAQRWMPLLLPEGQQPELLGVDAGRVGTVRRDDGSTQVTLAGWPLYTAAGDPGDHSSTGANGAEGTWFAVAPTGEKAAP
jgi:predicted lipoprotein with Yx(FWY)xxD motif